MSNLVPFREPSTPVERTPSNAWIDLVEPAAELAQQIAGTEFVPEAFRRNPAAVAACILYGAEIGIGPMQSLSKIDIVKGRPAPRAELARALLLAAGHKMWVVESNNTRVTVSGHRAGDPTHVMSVTWTHDDVKKAGISNQNYAKYPRQMLLARASAELARMVAPDALGGIGMFAEEADDVELTGAPLVATPVSAEAVKSGTTRQRRQAPPASTQATDPGESDATPVDDKPAVDMITEPQMKKMMASFNDAGISERADRLQISSTVIGRPIDTAKELTKDEASTVIEALEALNSGRASIVYDSDGTMTITFGQTELTAQ